MTNLQNQRTGGAEAASTRRAEILAVAAEVFREKGIVNATVRDIAQRAGILSGSLYHHFDSKEQMIEEILTSTGEPLLERCRTIIESAVGPSEALRGCIAAAVGYLAAAPNEAAILRNDARAIASMPRLAFVQGRREVMVDVWVRLVRDGQRRGVFRKEADPVIAVAAMWDAILTSTQWIRPDSKGSPKRVAAQLGDFFVYGLQTRKS